MATELGVGLALAAGDSDALGETEGVALDTDPDDPSGGAVACGEDEEQAVRTTSGNANIAKHRSAHALTITMRNRQTAYPQLKM